VGNIVVAALTALTIITLIIYEPAMHFYLKQRPFIRVRPGHMLPNPVWVLMIYSYFAFVLTWMREIVKDMEDFKGDVAEGCVTMPIKWGLKKASRFTLAVGVCALMPLLIAAAKLLLKQDWGLGFYTVIALILPIIAWMSFLPKKATTGHYAKASRYLKLIMLAGIGSLIIYYLEANG
jgi:4-hydroxybenzoate polyprenyltransferase